MKLKDMTPGGTTGSDQGREGDDRLNELAKKAEGVTKAIDEKKPAIPTDVRRSKPINGIEHGQYSVTRAMLYIDGVLWAEIDWDTLQGLYCIQDSTGHCLQHRSSIVSQMGGGGKGPSIEGMQAAIYEATAMIRDGRMPTPEEAATAFHKRKQSDR